MHLVAVVSTSTYTHVIKLRRHGRVLFFANVDRIAQLLPIHFLAHLQAHWYRIFSAYRFEQSGHPLGVALE